MKATKQAKNQTILQHGLSVWSYYRRLLKGDTEGFRLPQWYHDFHDEIFENLYDYKTIKHYTIFHDIGKPHCITFDADGKHHFPDHATKSKEIWDSIFPDKTIISSLIEHDMAFHTLKADQILELNLPTETLCTLMLAALAELHSNASMFGGIESDSFKIKFKKLEKAGNAICKKLFGHAYMYVLVRNDLSIPQQAVQASHAAIESARKHLKPGDEHPSVIICSIKNENKLLKCAEEFKAAGIDHTIFREPDIGNAATALASRPMIGKERKAFSRFQLMKG
jgi:hypothetical protein